LLNYLKNCHKDVHSVKTKALVNLFHGMMDNVKCHQVDFIKDEIWRKQTPAFISECQFQIIILKETTLKESVYHLLSAYLEGRLFQIDSLIKDEKAQQLYTAFVKNKGRV
jgi:hypothetical protein